MRFVSSALAVFAFALSSKFNEINKCIYFFNFFLIANAITSECQGISASVTVCNNHIKAMTKELPTVIELVSYGTSFNVYQYAY